VLYRATPTSPKMFESEFVDLFSRVPWFAVPVVYVPAIVGWIAWGWLGGATVPEIALQLGLGWFVWTLLEYWLHRTVFHWTPPFAWGERFHFILHGVHHTWYKDHLRLVMPPAASIAIGVGVWAGVRGLAALTAPLGLDPVWARAAFAGIMWGYLVYDMTHYYVHHGNPSLGVFKALRAHHAKHHHNAAFKDKKFGVSTTLWDHVFRTWQ
jgi:sterol desaturase/sphingolipid hydroxylase (fatty acid hydroxylase superfamily)